ncbi:MAG: hypothetical protein DMG02_30245 [Acidobacteria bacterium]|nr:MAG: hypothetical protein DMG02_30245 [Acidobacteriota bacterium]PYR13116.1 MAG: hypothetical protein DMF99_02315 [Acidobacteriota bacterium]
MIGPCLFVAPSLRAVATVTDPRLEETSERHRIQLSIPTTSPVTDPLALVDGVEGAVLGATRGFLDRAQMRFLERVLARGKRAWVYWRAEEAIETVDAERLRSFRRLWASVVVYERLIAPTARGRRRLARVRPALRWIYRGEFPIRRYDILADIARVTERAHPVPISPTVHPDGRVSVAGRGLYVRTDFWNRVTSGGSYGHTCYVAKELAATAVSLTCLLPHRYELLDALGVDQVVLDPPTRHEGEDSIVAATEHYARLLSNICRVVRPAFIYERLCLGNYAGARVARELAIPYIVEYNGSEISMQRSFDGTGMIYEDVYRAAEMAAFRQATAISVVSAPIADEVASRGVDRCKILVNPNGADVDAYAPPSQVERRSLREELGFRADDCIVGFTGTFGGWHGVDVLAAAIPRICAARPNASFLLIGEGNLTHLVDDVAAAHRLGDRVRNTGRVDQREGARLLKACDVFVSPHSSHMVDSRFFGSPTKIFEYMATGGAIVASNLEQIGEVLSPALRVSPSTPTGTATTERSILCTPGSVDELVDAVCCLIDRPDLRATLGHNARRAAVEEYSWSQHVRRLWQFVGRQPCRPHPEPVEQRERKRLETGDAYKDQAQKQWDNNPVGSQHAGEAPPHTLQWFLNVEAHRYGEYAPWMPEVMEFSRHRGAELLEIGGGLGTDLAQFARHGARVTDVDLSSGHLALAQENFRLRGLDGRFAHHDAERLPFGDNTFDVVYADGVIHHTPDTMAVVRDIHRVLKPGGRAIVMVYAENSWHYWRQLVGTLGLVEKQLFDWSMGEIMSRSVERSANDARPLVKVYTKARLRHMFRSFARIEIVQRQMVPTELPRSLRPFHRWIERVAGWNLIVKADKACA